MIRSDYRAKKYQDEFEAAVEHALALDPSNAEAWVSKAKRYLFADPEHGGDVAEAERLLSKAIALDSDLESARLLRAESYVRLGNEEAATSDWREVLEHNPDSEPARRGLQEHRR
jgi:cytochrome c-type biogenesis protein CcmH/NrfG